VLARTYNRLDAVQRHPLIASLNVARRFISCLLDTWVLSQRCKEWFADIIKIQA
jgi:hypothetical protein